MNKTEIMRDLSSEGGWRCHYCHTPLVPRGQEDALCEVSYQPVGGEGRAVKVYTLPDGYSWPTLDHKKPQLYGIDNDPDNLVLACLRCNSFKAHRLSYEEFYEMTAPLREKGGGDVPSR